MASKEFEFFVNNIFSLLVIVFGFMGNIFGLVTTLVAKKFNKETNYIYTYLFLFDTLFSFKSVILFMKIAHNASLVLVNQASCKSIFYISYLFAPLSPMMLAYISVHRLIQIKYPSLRYFIKDTRNNLIFALIILGYNALVYLPWIWLIGLLNFTFDLGTNSTEYNITVTDCVYQTVLIAQICTFFDLINSTLLPFLLMSVSSVVLIVYIFRMRRNISSKKCSKNERNRMQKDIRFSVTILFLNLFFLVLNFPSQYMTFSLVDLSVTYFSYFLFYFSYGVNFYILFFSNSVFRNEFLEIFRIRRILCC